jgi:hypothetical protein
MNWITEWEQQTLLLKSFYILLGYSGSKVYGDDRVSQPVHQFHVMHGENVRLSDGRSTARRVKSFRNGLAFSQRPLSSFLTKR